jgi:hypothetical protein
MQKMVKREKIILIIGDIITLGIVTYIGFASHGTAGTAGSRMLTTFIPLVAAWFLIPPHLKVYEVQVGSDWRQLWRPFWSMVLAAPMAAWIRGMLLDAPILPIFVIILGGVSALGILIWRGLFIIVLSRIKSEDG